MGISIELNPCLALREHGSLNRLEDECLPEKLDIGKEYSFLKNSQRVYWLSDEEYWDRGEIPLCKTEGNNRLSRPIASVKILEYSIICMRENPIQRENTRLLGFLLILKYILKVLKE